MPSSRKQERGELSEEEQENWLKNRRFAGLLRRGVILLPFFLFEKVVLLGTEPEPDYEYSGQL